MFEVMGHDMTEETKRAFAEETTAMLAPLLPSEPNSGVERVFGVKPDLPRQIAFQFVELSPAGSKPFVVHLCSQAA